MCFLLISRKLAAVLLKINFLKNPRWRACCATALIKTLLLLWKVISYPKAAYMPKLGLLCAITWEIMTGGGGGSPNAPRVNLLRSINQSIIYLYTYHPGARKLVQLLRERGL